MMCSFCGCGAPDEPGKDAGDKRAAHHHQVGLVRLEQRERAAIEVRVAQVDLVTDDELAGRLENAPLERLAVVRLAEREALDLLEALRQLVRDAHRSVARAVGA